MRRYLTVLLLLVSLLAQPWLAAAPSTAANLDTEICTGTGLQLVHERGDPSDPTHGGSGHHDCMDCCCASPVAILPPAWAPVLPEAGHEAVVMTLSARQLAAQWLAPLSRGPPLHS
jgi:hypothetical protein